VCEGEREGVLMLKPEFASEEVREMLRLYGVNETSFSSPASL